MIVSFILSMGVDTMAMSQKYSESIVMPSGTWPCTWGSGERKWKPKNEKIWILCVEERQSLLVDLMHTYSHYCWCVPMLRIWHIHTYWVLKLSINKLKYSNKLIPLLVCHARGTPLNYKITEVRIEKRKALWTLPTVHLYAYLVVHVCMLLPTRGILTQLLQCTVYSLNTLQCMHSVCTQRDHRAGYVLLISKSYIVLDIYSTSSTWHYGWWEAVITGHVLSSY